MGWKKKIIGNEKMSTLSPLNLPPPTEKEKTESSRMEILQQKLF